MSSPYFYAPMPGDTATNYLLLSNAETDKRIYPHFVLENVAYRQQATGSASYNGHGLAKSMDSFEPEVRQRSVHEDLSSNGIAPVEAACGSHSVQTPHNMPTIEMFSWPAHSQSYVKTSPTINEGACTTLGPDPFAHIDLSILEMIASGSGINDCDEEPSRFTSTGVSSAQTPDLQYVGQEVCNTQHINSISEDATESEGHVGVSLLAESTAPAYRLAQPRAPARGRKARKTPRRPRAPAVKATRPQATSKGTLRCEMCDRDKDTGSEDYAHQASLNRHIRTSHLDRSRWQCTLCDKSMVRSDALGRHLKRQHHMPEADAKAVVAHVAASKYLTD